jgi:hypothetical protein
MAAIATESIAAMHFGGTLGTGCGQFRATFTAELVYIRILSLAALAFHVKNNIDGKKKTLSPKYYSTLALSRILHK